MLEFLIDNICVMFGGYVFQQTIGVSSGIKCISLFADLFVYSYETDFLHDIFKKKFKFSFIDDVINNSKFGDYVDSVYPQKLLTLPEYLRIPSEAGPGYPLGASLFFLPVFVGFVFLVL